MNFLKDKRILNKKNIFFIFSIGIIFIFFFSGSKNDLNQNVEEKNKIQKVLVKFLEPQLFSKKLILRGFTESSRSIILKSQVEGKVNSISFNKGLNVKKGDEILTIDPEDKVAIFKEMEALLDQREKEYEIAEKLFSKGFRSEVNLSKAKVKYETALAKFEKSKVELDNTKILIPFDSFIEESFVELGDYVKKGDKIVKIVDLDPILLISTISEQNINFLKIGQSGKIKLANGFETFGNLNYISSTSDLKTRKFKVQIEIDNKNKKILSGQTGEVEIKLNPEDSYFIPSSVITLDDDGNLGVKIVKGKKVEFVKINIISDTGNGYWVEKFGDENVILITRGQEYVLTGETVETKFDN